MVIRTLARKFKIKTRAQVYKEFGKEITIYDQTMRDKEKRPTMVAKLIRPEYKNVWNKVTNTNTQVPALSTTGTRHRPT